MYGENGGWEKIYQYTNKDYLPIILDSMLWGKVDTWLYALGQLSNFIILQWSSLHNPKVKWSKVWWYTSIIPLPGKLSPALNLQSSSTLSHLLNYMLMSLSLEDMPVNVFTSSNEPTLKVSQTQQSYSKRCYQSTLSMSMHRSLYLPMQHINQ